jgi:hypothetical protein
MVSSEIYKYFKVKLACLWLTKWFDAGSVSVIPVISTESSTFQT